VDSTPQGMGGASAVFAGLREIGYDGYFTIHQAQGISTAAEWVYSGKIFPAQEAYDRRLISEILEPEELMPRARQIAAEIVQNTSSISVALCRQLMWKMLGADHPIEANIIESKSLNWMFGMPDAREGIVSFLEKRPPNFPMKTGSDMPAFYPWWQTREFKYF